MAWIDDAQKRCEAAIEGPFPFTDLPFALELLKWARVIVTAVKCDCCYVTTEPPAEHATLCDYRIAQEFLDRLERGPQ